MNIEIKPVLSALLAKKTGPFLIALQIAITLAVVVNASFVIDGRLKKMSMPVGIDTENIFTLGVVSLSDSENYEDMIQEDLRRLRSIPGVRDVISPLNYLQGGSTRFEFFRTKPVKVRGISTFTNVNYTDEHGLEALGVKLLEGRFFKSEEVQYIDDKFEGFPTNVVITTSLAKNLFADEKAIGGVIYVNESTQLNVIGVISDIATGWLAKDGNFLANTKYNMMFFPYFTYVEGVNYLIRTDDNLVNSIIPEVEKTLLEIDSNRLVRRVLTQEEVIEKTFSNDYATMAILVAVMALMLLITALGIVGLAGYSVKQRTRQIGTRRALGATKKDILKYFLLENVFLTSFGIVMGIGLTYGLNYLLTSQFDGAKIEPRFLFLGIGLVYLLGLVAVYWPAHKASSISPATATRAG